jgi:hypothetical protein
MKTDAQFKDDVTPELAWEDAAGGAAWATRGVSRVVDGLLVEP